MLPGVIAPVVTLFEAYGAGAAVVGPRLAEALGVPFVGQAWSSEDLEALEDPDQQVGPVQRALALVGRRGPAEGLLARAAPDPEAEAVHANVRLVLGAARDGAVILGRNATVILAEDPRAFHVKLDGPRESRVAWAAREAGLELPLADRRLAREDRVRAEMSLRLHNWDPRTNDRYDLVVNTSRVPLEAVVDLVVAARRITLAARS